MESLFQRHDQALGRHAATDPATIVSMSYQRLLLLGIVAFSNPARATEIPPLRGHVNDTAGVFTSQARATLEARLTAVERATTQQIVVQTINDLGGLSVEDYALNVFKAWKLGQAGKDNGVLLVFAKADRKVRIEVGYGLEGQLTDVQSSQIIRNVMIPEFRRSAYEAGINAGVDAILAALSNAASRETPHVFDEGELLSFPERQDMESHLSPYDSKGFSLLLLSQKNLQGVEIETSARYRLEQWMKSNSAREAILLLVAIEEKKATVVVSKGLEEDIPLVMKEKLLDSSVFYMGQFHRPGNGLTFFWSDFHKTMGIIVNDRAKRLEKKNRGWGEKILNGILGILVGLLALGAGLALVVLPAVGILTRFLLWMLRKIGIQPAWLEALGSMFGASESGSQAREEKTRASSSSKDDTYSGGGGRSGGGGASGSF